MSLNYYSLLTKIMNGETEINEVIETFSSIYRINTDNGIILDIPDSVCVLRGNVFKYTIYTDENIENNKIYLNNLNGTITNIKDGFVYASFGGLLSKIPLNFFNLSISPMINNYISINYYIESSLV
jgi:hypothetical protein